MENLNETVTIF